MKKIASAFCTIALFSLVACNNAGNETKTEATKTDTTASTTPAAEAAPPPPPMDSAAMMKMWMEMKTPGDMHKMLASQDGNWDNEMTMWMEPGKPPMTSKSTSTNKMIMGGRYQQSTYKGTMMGEPFEGVSTLGYDNTKKKFVNSWVDNGGTGIMYMEGTYDPGTKTLTLSGSMPDPATGKDCSMRQVIVFTDDKHHTMEMYNTPAGGQEMKMMEIKSTKR
ncbi:MAG: DUF1579 domain-containing protein [Pseudobacter sp.]|uniref:DUF1579 domain-containing protein n=1 Tax=Pseudobacter sp. TaxID=2045420 RepID=UPI003F7CFFC2